MVPEISTATNIFFVILGHFWPFIPLTAQKMKIWKNEKNPADIIILHKCTKNHDYMPYCSWDMACDRCNCCFSFWAIFCPFTFLTAPKMKISKKWKNAWRYHHCTKNCEYRLYCSWDMAHDRCNYFSFYAIFCTFTPLTAQKMKISKKINK